MKTLTIQPNAEGLKLPYPWHIDIEGNVLHQEFWKGNPKRLVGFAPKGRQDKIIFFPEVFEEGIEILNIFREVEPVFSDSKESWFSQTSETGFTYKISEIKEKVNEK